MVTYAKISPKMVNPRDLARNAQTLRISGAQNAAVNIECTKPNMSYTVTHTGCFHKAKYCTTRVSQQDTSAMD